MQATPLFRAEALAHAADTGHGEVLSARTPGTTLLVGLALATAAVLLAAAALGHYTRKEHVVGSLAPSAGLIKLYTPQAGTVLERRVSEGQAVRRGDVLMVIGSDRATRSSQATQASMQDELRLRRDSLKREVAKQADIDLLAAQGVGERMRSLQQEIEQARAQSQLQQERVRMAEAALRRHQELLGEHFVSEATVQQKMDELMGQRQQLAQTERSITALRRDLDAARLELAAAAFRRSNNTSALERQVSELAQQLTEGDARAGVLLVAPADGTVTTILAEAGQAANPNLPLLSLLPAGAQLRAELLVPTRAAGFIKPGQSVALRYQAFPYQRFGHHLGQVLEVGRSVIQPQESALTVAVNEPVYRVTVSLPQQQMQAYGQALPLRAGMAVDADIHVDRRRLIDWIFDPLLSVSGRI